MGNWRANIYIYIIFIYLDRLVNTPYCPLYSKNIAIKTTPGVYYMWGKPFSIRGKGKNIYLDRLNSTSTTGESSASDLTSGRWIINTISGWWYINKHQSVLPENTKAGADFQWNMQQHAEATSSGPSNWIHSSCAHCWLYWGRNRVIEPELDLNQN